MAYLLGMIFELKLYQSNTNNAIVYFQVWATVETWWSEITLGGPSEQQSSKEQQ